MTLSMVKRIGYLQIDLYVGKVQMEDKTCSIPVGVVKDALIQIDKFSFPLDFAILDVRSNIIITLILGIHFMKTTRMLVDIDIGEVNVRIKDREVSYKVICVT